VGVVCPPLRPFSVNWVRCGPSIHRVLLPTITAPIFAARRWTFRHYWGGEKPRRNAKYAYLRALSGTTPRLSVFDSVSKTLSPLYGPRSDANHLPTLIRYPPNVADRKCRLSVMNRDRQAAGSRLTIGGDSLLTCYVGFGFVVRRFLAGLKVKAVGFYPDLDWIADDQITGLETAA